ncbi:ABC transporter family substrate-binding protein [Georgenia thermotolerans]|uniref:ABC transporter family substrate-binding protein n=1 Tax=Georgenia thermotolerans TaxID=527326 RepID=A0A7J5UII2_9MICO|nr:ABC transporter family substrate-binding protein [Georgenia thermotolerans]KAE8762185.1 ABC transporter family substrate-binding protein [Georgenia thermotolerans]
MRRRATALLTGAALALALVGCAADDGTGPGPAPTTAGELADVNATPRDGLAEGGTLRRAVERLPAQWNPLHVAGGDVSASEIRGPISVTNWDTDARGVTTPNDNFVVDVEDEVVDGQEVVTLHLNPDAVWNNGEPITWEDYAATVDACSGGRPDFECATGAFAAVESVAQGESEFEVVVTFAATFPDWPALLGTVLPAEGVADAEAFNTGWLDHPEEWFTGPFRIGEVDTAQQVVTLVPNERWWGPAPKLDTIEYRAVSADAAATAFANHELDVLDIGADANAYERARAVPDAEVRRAAGPDWRQITFNTTAGPLADPAVRQAIARAIDRDAVAASSLAGLPEDLQRPLNNHIFMQGQDGYEDNAGEYAYDPDAAAAQLDDAGWVLDPATGVRARDGKSLTLHYTVFSGVPASTNEGQLVQAQLKEVGIAVVLDPVPETALGQVLGEGDFELVSFSWYGSPYPLLGVANLYGDPATTPMNYARLAVPGLDDLLGQIMTETDHATRLDLADRADELLWEALPILPLYQRPQLVATASDLANVGAAGLGSTRPEDWGYVR